MTLFKLTFTSVVIGVVEGSGLCVMDRVAFGVCVVGGVCVVDGSVCDAVPLTSRLYMPCPSKIITGLKLDGTLSNVYGTSVKKKKKELS